MRSGGTDAAYAARLWWTVPLGLVLLTAVVFVAVVLPALASGPGVPSQLVVNPAPSAADTTTQSPRAASTTRQKKTKPSPTPTSSATVVVPAVQPVVRESGDRHDDGSGSASGEPRDR
ncbi:MAG TPA: hypothetical protein VFH66_15535 [Mycobacteriales bacterium]|nr:hypothetical protein [Mycobacteriales bacterium]